MNDDKQTNSVQLRFVSKIILNAAISESTHGRTAIKTNAYLYSTDVLPRK